LSDKQLVGSGIFREKATNGTDFEFKLLTMNVLPICNEIIG